MRQALLSPHGLALECDEPERLVSALNSLLSRELEFTPFLQVRYAAPEVWLVKINPLEDLL